jgi:hypothetical protein
MGQLRDEPALVILTANDELNPCLIVLLLLAGRLQDEGSLSAQWSMAKLAAKLAFQASFVENTQRPTKIRVHLRSPRVSF